MHPVQCKRGFKTWGKNGRLKSMKNKLHRNSSVISNHHSLWSTRTFDLDLHCCCDDIVGQLDQFAPEKQSNPYGGLENDYDGQFDEYEFARSFHRNAGYLKIDLAIPELRLVNNADRMRLVDDTHAEFLVYTKFGDVTISSWKRFNDFKVLVNKLDPRDFPTVWNNPTLPYHVIRCRV